MNKIIASDADDILWVNEQFLKRQSGISVI